MSITNAEFLIFASNLPVHHVQQVLVAARIPYKVVLGMYKNESETAFIVQASAWAFLNEAHLIDTQESILVVEHRGSAGLRAASLLYLDTFASVDIGYFGPVGKDLAVTREGYTYDPATDTFFTTLTKEDLAAQGIIINENGSVSIVDRAPNDKGEPA